MAGEDKLVAKYMRLQYMERMLRTDRIQRLTYNPGGGMAAVSVNGMILQEPEDLYPSEQMVANVALGVGV